MEDPQEGVGVVVEGHPSQAWAAEEVEGEAWSYVLNRGGLTGLRDS
jgi:hypothetical protein